MGSDKIAELKLKFSGLFDSKSFYNSIIDYLKDHGFKVKEEETEYKDDGNEVSLKTQISFEKSYDDKSKVKGKIELNIDKLKEVLVKQGNSSKSLNKVESLEIELEAEYENRFEDSFEDNLSKLLAKVYKETFGKPHFDKLKNTAKKELEGLVNEIKKQLNLYKYFK